MKCLLNLGIIVIIIATSACGILSKSQDINPKNNEDIIDIEMEYDLETKFYLNNNKNMSSYD
jgi:hypothetical protein